MILLLSLVPLDVQGPVLSASSCPPTRDGRALDLFRGLLSGFPRVDGGNAWSPLVRHNWLPGEPRRQRPSQWGYWRGIGRWPEGALVSGGDVVPLDRDDARHCFDGVAFWRFAPKLGWLARVSLSLVEPIADGPQSRTEEDSMRC